MTPTLLDRPRDFPLMRGFGPGCLRVLVNALERIVVTLTLDEWNEVEELRKAVRKSRGHIVRGLLLHEARRLGGQRG